MEMDLQKIRDDILERSLPDIAFEGWVWPVIERGARAAGHENTMAAAVFPAGIRDVLSHFADRADRWMLEDLRFIDPASLRIRDRIRRAVMARIESLAPWREQERRALAYLALPHRKPLAFGLAWRTADRIWTWAGDEAADYNHYTKRALLSAVLASVSLYWMNGNKGPDMKRTGEFLDRRIENVMQIGALAGKIKESAGRKRAWT